MALVFEFMSGGSLHDTLHSDQKLAQLTLLDRVQILAQAAVGLAHLHAHGVVH